MGANLLLQLLRQKSEICLHSNLTLVGEHALPIAIQHASLEDLEALYEIEKRCFTEEAFSKEQMDHFLKASDAVNLVAQVNGKIAGFILGLIEHHRKSCVGHVYTIDVASRYRRMGVGLKLLEAIEEDFRKRGAEACFLEVRFNNLAARGLYRKNGYTELGRLDNYYARGNHGIRLKKKLKK